MKIRTILATALAVTLLGACSSNDTGTNPIEGGEGGPAAMRLALTFPQAEQTRADEAATSQESAVKDIHIYVFNSDGSVPSDGTSGYFGPFQIPADFTAVGGGVYEMNDPVTTTAGTKNIYVAINLTAAGLGGAYASEALFLQQVTTVHDKLLQYNGATLESITMFGKTQEYLKAKIEGENEIDIDVERAVARVVTTRNQASFDVDWAGSDDMSFVINKYFVTQDAYKSFVAPNFFAANGRVRSLIYGESNWANVLRIYDPQDYLSTSTQPPYVTIGSDPGAGNRAPMNGFYIGENAVTTASTYAQQGNTTYAFVQTTMTATLTARMNSTADDIIYDNTNPIAAGDDMWLIRVTGIADYICHEDNKDAVFLFLKTKHASTDVNAYIYKKGYVYYRVFLNSTENGSGGIHKYNVYRNQFIHIDVRGISVDINEPGGFGGGYPGDKTDPEVPVDPTDPDNPNPVDPPDPIDELESNLLVNITVKPWAYVPNRVILE